MEKKRDIPYNWFDLPREATSQGPSAWKRAVPLLACAFAALAANAAEPPATAIVTVDPDVVVGAVKPMNAVNNGPVVKRLGNVLKRDNFGDYRAARIPFARTHDSVNCVPGGAHTCDITAVFPNFDADENDPKSYDFVFTDYYLDHIRRAGTQVFFRLGQTIEHGPKKYGVLPPKDFAKWARICEHVVRHSNEGWAWGCDDAWTTLNTAWSNQFNIVYWEIWNEPNLDLSDGEPPRRPRCWGGTVTNFFQLYETAAKHLKAKFPGIKIGGPAMTCSLKWGERFLSYCHDNAVPLDFLSWHTYSTEPGRIAEQCAMFRELMDRHGFAKAESILNEWNYVRGWTDDWLYSVEVQSGRFNQKAAAFIAATMIDCQSAPVDMLMFYDAKPHEMNSMFDKTTFWPMKGYYPFYAWSKMADRGTQVSCVVKEGRGKWSDADFGPLPKSELGRPVGSFRAAAARGEDGSGAVFVARYSEDDNVNETADVCLRVKGVSLAKGRCLLTDAVRVFTEVPLEVMTDGSAVVRLQPNSFAYVEF